MNSQKSASLPWGRWEILCEEMSYKVKRITVNPGQRFSYQQHHKRSEYWIVVEGRGVATLDKAERVLQMGDTFKIEAGTPHRFSNTSKTPVTFIEVQMGEYLGEDDIVRLDDDYGRAK